MNGFQLIFFWFVTLYLAWLVLDGALTGSVWVKGRGPGKKFGEAWAHKKSRYQSPVAYWLAMVFYSGGLLWLLVLVTK